MDLKQLEAFTNVIKLQSFSKAAECMYLTQPTISAHINSLEKELNTNLIIRTTKEVYASESGKILYEYARDMINLRDKVYEIFREHSIEMKGVIAIAASTIPAKYVLPELMLHFREKYPDISFNVLHSDSLGVVNYILNQNAEIGMIGTKIDNSKCNYQPFLEDKLVIITPNNEHYSNGTDWLTKEQFIKEPFIIREKGSGTRKETENFLKSIGINPEELNVVAQMDDSEAIRESVGRGLGIAIVSQRAAKGFERFGMIKIFKFDHVTLKRQLCLVHYKGRPLSQLAKIFIEYAAGYRYEL